MMGCVPAHTRPPTRRLAEVITPRRLVTTALVLLALVVSIVGLQSVKDQRAATCSHGVVVSLIPCPGDTDLRQGTIGVVMATGWQATLTVDGTRIPEDEVVVRGQQYLFTPGPGTVTGALAPGQHSALVTYYATGTGPAGGQQFAWAFRTS
jgi:hypothetical protein